MTSTFRIDPELGDLVLDNAGVSVVSGGEKLNQDLRIALRTDASERDVGAGLSSLIGQEEVTQFDVQFLIAQSAQSMIELQRTYNRDRRTPDELLARIRRVRIQPTRDPRQVDFLVEYESLSGDVGTI